MRGQMVEFERLIAFSNGELKCKPRFFLRHLARLVLFSNHSNAFHNLSIPSREFHLSFYPYTSKNISTSQRATEMNKKEVEVEHL